MLDSPIGGFLGAVFLLAVPVTLLLSVAVRRLYRRAVTRLMFRPHQPTGPWAAGAGPGPARSEHGGAPPPEPGTPRP
ncbi:MAG: hypothetical protein AAF547_22135, partial [Actinomycetota bacterium]